MADPWLQGIQVGAQIAEQRMANSARLQQLKLQQAQQQMQERQIAAQAQMYTEHANLYKVKAEQDKEDAFLLKAAGDKVPELIEKYKAIGHADADAHELAIKEAITPLMFVSPTAFQKVASGISAMTRADASVKAPFTPSLTTLKDSAGNPIDVINTGPNSAAQVRQPASQGQQPTSIREAQAITDLQNKIDAEQDPAVKAQLERQLANLQATALPTGTTTEIFDPQTGAPIMRTQTGRATAVTDMGKPTLANVTKLQQKLTDTLTTVDVANRLQPLINDETIGVKAAIGSLFNDRILAQAFPDLSSKSRAKAEVLVARLRSSALSELKSDGSIAEKERIQILKAVPEINDPIDSPQHALDQIKAIRKIAALKGITIAKTLKQPIHDNFLLALDDEDLIEATASGLLTQAEAIAAYRKRRQP